ncbi:acetyltransferase [Leptospira sp. 201903071]|uniref:acetyltransferase n=1 Tax=Leptospira ainazelensis TaxID=2810034 RepID=UPI001965195A|nr:acetyltransferase [Leptospira ainazelensis]MBM9501945.1 acetyltransferase [Leptospira ainazelensis]
MKTFLVACGGHGRVVLDSFLNVGNSVEGIIDKNLDIDSYVFGVRVVGGDDLLKQFDPNSTRLINGFGFVKSISTRKNKYEDWERSGFQIVGIKHQSVFCGSECIIEISSQIMAGAVLQNRVRVGENVVINTRASIDHDCVIGKHTFISPGVVLCGGVSVEESVFIGAGAIVLPGVRIGKNSVVSAGALVNKDVESETVVAGSPIRKLKG